MKIQFKANLQKTLESIIYLVSKNNELIPTVIFKLLFESDYLHLNSNSRPITGNTYFLKLDGFVPDIAEKILNQDFLIVGFLDPEPYPLTKDSSEHVLATRNPQLKYLSKSDIHFLDLVLDHYRKKTEDVQLSISKNNAMTETSMNHSIDFKLLITNTEVIDYLSENDPLLIVI